MKNALKKFPHILLTACVAFSLFAGNVSFLFAKTVEVNVAGDAEVSVAAEDASHPKGNLNDGDKDTFWSYPGAEWPISASFKLAQITTVNKVVVTLGSADWSEKATVDVEIKYARNGITTDLQTFGTKKTTVPFGSEVSFEAEVPVDASHIYVEVSNPTAAGDYTGEITLWPSINEVEIFETQEEKLSHYNDIANQASITTDGTAPNDSSLLVDGDNTTLYKFHNGQLTSEKNIDLSFDEERTIDAFEIEFENVGSSDPYSYAFEYSIQGKNGDGEYVTLVNHATANRTDNTLQDFKIDATKFTDIRIIMHQTTNVVDGTAGIGWPAIAEFSVFGSEKETQDTESIAFKKPVHANSNRSLAANVNDGSTKTAWKGSMYPGYVDIDLESNYLLDEIEVYTPQDGYTQYTIYTSMDGRDFDKLAEKTSKDTCPETGEVYQANQKEARYVRIYVEYNSASSQSVINEVRVMGKASDSALQERPAINIKDYADSSYANASIEAQDTYDEVYGIISRRLGDAYKNWFTLELTENTKGHDYDFFELSNVDNKIHIKGNDGVSLAMGLNHYLKYYCNINISQVGDQVTMPDSIVKLDKTIFQETKAKVRYAYNYCTLSYSMPFYGEEEWRNEMDWLALNGVNVVLDATAQEEVWRRFLTSIGYEHEDIKDFIAGPAYYAWAYMANLSGFGGPVHDSWFEERTDLARKNQLAMRRLGMQPVLQGYSGMVPNDLADHDATGAEDVIKQGTWCSFQRPDMLRTDSKTYEKYAALFYQAQKEVYGDVSDYYATDPFHEGGNVGGMSPATVSSKVLDSLLAYDDDAVWIIQSWQGNPSNELLNGLDGRKEHALILDLYADKTPNYDSYGDTAEFDKTPWVFCMLNNFGGRLGLHGHLDNLANNIPNVFNTTEYVEGIGITPEASVNNPLLYDFLFETVWTSDATKDLEVIDLDAWLKDYATRRYGAESESAQEALGILKDTVYKASMNMKGQGAPESVVNARPALSINAASSWGNATIDYNKADLEEAAELLLKDYDKLKDSEGYLYDLATVLQQVLSNSAQEYQRKMSAAYRSNDLDKFEEMSGIFMDIIDNMEKVTSTSKYYLLGTWVNQAKSLAANADDFSKELYEMNAKSLITTWGSINQAESGGLHDYSNRQWSGLIDDFYKARWQIWIDNRTKELQGENASDPNWFEWEWAWARGNKEFTSEPSSVNLKTTGEQILENFSVYNPASDDSNDIDVKTITGEAGNYQQGVSNEGGADMVLDGDTSTRWHTVYGGSPRDDHYLIFTLDEEQEISGLRYLPRNDGSKNGVITAYKVFIKNSDSEDWQEVIANGVLDESNLDWQILTFDNAENVKAKQVKFQVMDATTGEAGSNYSSLTEMRILKAKKSASDLNALQTVIEEAEKLQEKDYTKASWTALQEALINAKAMNDQQLQADIDAAASALRTAMDALVKLEDTTVIKQVLKSAMDKATDLIESDKFATLAPNVQAMIQVRLNEATIVYEDEEATIAACTTAWKNLADALQYSDFVADKAELKKLLAECNDLNTESYTQESVQAFEEALAQANAVYEDDNALQARIDAAYNALIAAKNGLTEKPIVKVDKNALSYMITVSKEKMNEQDKYFKDANWDTFVKALANAEEVMADEAATQVAVNKATNALSDAYISIRLLPNEEMLKQLEDFINYTKNINRALYSAKDLKVIDDAANKAQEMLDKKEFSEDEFDAFAITMGNVMDVIDNNKIKKPADKDQNKNDGTQNGVKAPGTADTTNAAGLLMMLLAGCGVMMVAKRRQKR